MALNVKKKEKQEKPQQPKKKTKRSGRAIVNTICICILSLILIGSVASFVIVQSVLGNANIVEGIEGLSSANSTQIYDSKGELITTLSTLDGVRENIDFEDIPQVVIDAFLATEDSRFYKHNGFDFPRFMKAALENVKAGGISQGGSTLTMQLVDVKLFSEEEKATYGTKEKIEQKIVEIFKSMEIESQLDKNKILENYMNSVNYGGPARGLQKGAQYYFGKDASEVTLSEAAFLAGVVNAPGAYNPYYGTESWETESGETVTVDHYELAMQRRNQVLYLMNYHGYITDEEYKLAKSDRLSFSLNGVTNFDTEKNLAFIDTAIAEVKEKTGKDPYTTPMKIYTTMNPDAQALADSLCNGEGVDFPDDLFQTGFVAMNNQTGAVVAIGGGRSYTGGADQRNRGAIDTHQIGSTAKPIVDYAEAFEYLGYSTEHVFEDGPVAYGAGGNVMQNYSRHFNGDVTFKYALGTSLNTPAYKTLLEVVDKIGVSKEVEILNNMGIDLKEEQFTYGISIGGSDLVASPLQMAAAYSVFANEGNYITPYTVKKIEFIDSDEKDYKASQEKQRVFSEETAFLMSYLLKDCVDNHSYQTLVNTLSSWYPVYGKSGTSDYGDEAAYYDIPDGAAKDKWMVGFTTQYTCACWAGYDYPIKGKNTYLDEYKVMANVEGRVVKAMLDELTTENPGTIAQPSGVVSIRHIQGLFPYATASGGNSKLMVTGLINKKFAGKLDKVSPDPLENLNSLDASIDDQGNVTIKFAPYPDKEKLKVASDTKTMTAGGTSASGKRIFDKSFLFGCVKYSYQILVNGKQVAKGTSSDATITKQIPVQGGEKVEVIGCYKYSEINTTSNKITKTLQVKEQEKTYTVGNDFLGAFGGETYEQSRSMLENYVATMMPGIEFTFAEDPNTPAGAYSNKNTIKSGTKVTSKNKYVIYIGSKEIIKPEPEPDPEPDPEHPEDEEHSEDGE